MRSLDAVAVAGGALAVTGLRSRPRGVGESGKGESTGSTGRS